MSTPREFLPVYVQFDIERYLSYSWKPSLITEIIYRQHGYRIVHNCVNALRDGTDCPRRCKEHCWIKRVGKPDPDPEWLEELRRKYAPIVPLDWYRK